MIQLYEYQQKYLADLPARAIMAADTGTGKTFMALAHYQQHASGQPLLILAPASKIRTGDWERDVTEFFGEGNEPDYEIYSYEKFSRDPSLKQFKNGKRAIWQKYAPGKFKGVQHAVICDEVHRAKNPQSGIGSRVFIVSKDASFFVGLSATPLPNNWIDAANYFKIFGFVRNITEFKKRYCQIEDYKGYPEIVNYYRKGELTEFWQSISRPLDKADAIDLPSRTFVGVNFPKTREYTKTIIERKDKDGNLLDTPSSLAHALRQTLTDNKLEYTADLLAGTNENVVIFYNYISEREALLKLFKKRELRDKKIYRMDGEKHELPNKADWAGVKNSVTLSHYRSGSTGVEMTYATQVIYFSPTYSYADYLQSLGRVYRNGQMQKTTFYNFRTPLTIEQDIYDTLRGKNDFQLAQWMTKLEQKEARND